MPVEAYAALLLARVYKCPRPWKAARMALGLGDAGEEACRRAAVEARRDPRRVVERYARLAPPTGWRALLEGRLLAPVDLDHLDFWAHALASAGAWLILCDDTVCYPAPRGLWPLDPRYGDLVGVLHGLALEAGVAGSRAWSTLTVRVRDAEEAVKIVEELQERAARLARRLVLDSQGPG